MSGNSLGIPSSTTCSVLYGDVMSAPSAGSQGLQHEPISAITGFAVDDLAHAQLPLDAPQVQLNFSQDPFHRDPYMSTVEALRKTLATGKPYVSFPEAKAVETSAADLKKTPPEVQTAIQDELGYSPSDLMSEWGNMKWPRDETEWAKTLADFEQKVDAAWNVSEKHGHSRPTPASPGSETQNAASSDPDTKASIAIIAPSSSSVQQLPISLPMGHMQQQFPLTGPQLNYQKSENEIRAETGRRLDKAASDAKAAGVPGVDTDRVPADIELARGNYGVVNGHSAGFEAATAAAKARKNSRAEAPVTASATTPSNSSFHMPELPEWFFKASPDAWRVFSLLGLAAGIASLSAGGVSAGSSTPKPVTGTLLGLESDVPKA